MEIVVQWPRVFIFPAVDCACLPSVCFQVEKGQSHNICIRLPINQPRAETRWCCCSYSRESRSNRSQYRSRRQPPRLTSDLTSSFRLGRQLQAEICKCKRQSYSRSLCVPNHPSSTLAAWRQALSVIRPSLHPACSVAQNGDKRVKIKRPLLNLRTNAQTHGQL